MDGAAFTDGNFLELPPDLRFETSGGSLSENGDVPAYQRDSVREDIGVVGHRGVRWRG